MKHKKIKLAMLVVCGFAAILSVSPAFANLPNLPESPIVHWQFMRSINLTSSGDFAKIILPHDLTKTNKTFSDVRIVNQNGEEAQYLIKRGASVSGGNVSARLLNSSFSALKTQFVADTGSDGVVHTGLSINTSSANFKRQVSIFASNNLIPIESASWSLVTDKGYIFKFTDSVTGFSSGQNTVNFSANTSRYFKVVIGSGEEGTVSVVGATVFGEMERNVSTYTKNVSVTVFNNPERKSTEVIADLVDAGLLSHAITITSSDKNYSRRVVIETSNDNKNWVYIGDGSISNIKTSLFEGASTRVDYPEQNNRYIRLSIINNDNQPLSIGGDAVIEGAEVSAIFMTKSGENYSLYYGNPNASAPVYDITRIATYIEENTIPTATLGAENINPSYVAPVGPVVPFTEQNKWLLNSVLVIVVIGIGLGIAFYLKKYLGQKGTGGGFNSEDPRI